MLTHDTGLSLKTHVTRTVSVCFAMPRQLQSIRQSVSWPILQLLIVSLVLSQLDYRNSILVSILQYQLKCLQSVMNSATQLVVSSSMSDHITPLLHQLHWRKAPGRIQFKLAVLKYKCIQCQPRQTVQTLIIQTNYSLFHVTIDKFLQNSKSCSLDVATIKQYIGHFNRLTHVTAFAASRHQIFAQSSQKIAIASSLHIFRVLLRMLFQCSNSFCRTNTIGTRIASKSQQSTPLYHQWQRLTHVQKEISAKH